ncbi:MAG: metal-dependent transcriptional regulator [Clostridium sp.]
MKDSFHTVRGYENINLNKKLLTPSMEDYLEMIYRCCENEDFIKLNKLAQNLSVRDSSASKMMKKLGNLGLIKYEPYGVIRLTDEGKEIGKFLLERHNIIAQFLINIGVEDEVLIETELIEHVISSDTVYKIDMLNRFISGDGTIPEKFKEYKEKYNK